MPRQRPDPDVRAGSGGRTTSVKEKIRRILGDDNADGKDLFSAELGLGSIQQVPPSDADRFVIDQLRAEGLYHDRQVRDLQARIEAFAARAPTRDEEARAVLETIPYVGPVTIEVVVSELGDVQQFPDAKAAGAYSGPVPKVRQTGGKESKELRTTKEGSGILRWAPVESARRLVGLSQRWERVYQRIKKRSGAKRAIVRAGAGVDVRDLRDAQDDDPVQGDRPVTAGGSPADPMRAPGPPDPRPEAVRERATGRALARWAWRPADDPETDPDSGPFADCRPAGWRRPLDVGYLVTSERSDDPKEYG